MNRLGWCQPAAASSSAVNTLGMILASMVTLMILIVISLRFLLLIVMVLVGVGLLVANLCGISSSIAMLLLLGLRLLVQPCVDGTVVDAFRRQDGLSRFGFSKGIHSSCAGAGAVVVGCHASAIID